jgi:hypothetical protein
MVCRAVNRSLFKICPDILLSYMGSFISFVDIYFISKYKLRMLHTGGRSDEAL